MRTVRSDPLIRQRDASVPTSRSRNPAAAGLFVAFATLARSASATAQEKSTYAEHVRPILSNHCLLCHNAEKLKGGLDLGTYATAMAGSSSGKVLNPGDPDGSTLIGVISHTREPKMPAGGSKIPDADIAVIRKWIADGCLETRDAKPAAAAAAPAPAIAAAAAPAAAGTMFTGLGLPLGPIVESERPGAAVAMATHPTSPLVALAGQKQVLVYSTRSADLVGVLPLENDMPQSLRFGRDGRTLVVGAGIGAKSGRVHVFDVQDGRQLAALGEEFDAVRAADIAPRGERLALGGTSKVVKVLSTRNGALLHKIEKHTDWITDVAYSPDGILLATADRAGGLFVWEAGSDALMYALPAHPAAITSIDWRADSNLLASACEDGQVRLWEMAGGSQTKAWKAHDCGALCVRFARDGRLVSAGRDKLAKTWDAAGTAIRSFPPLSDIALAAAFDVEGKRLLAADLLGVVRVFNTDDGAVIADLSTNPPPLASQLAEAQQRLEALRGERAQREQAVAAAKQQIAAAEAALAAARQQADAAAQTLVQSDAAIASQNAEYAKLQAGGVRIELEASRQQLLQLRTKHQPAAEKAAAIQQAADHAAAALAAAGTQQEAMPARLQQLTAAVDNANAALAAARADHAAKRATANSKAAAAAAFAQSAEQIKAQAAAAPDNAALRQAAAKAAEALALLVQDHAAANVLAEQSGNVIGGKEAELKAAEQAAAAATAERDALSARIEQLTQAAESAKQAAMTAATALTQARKPVEAAETRVADLEQQYRQLLDTAKPAYGL